MSVIAPVFMLYGSRQHVEQGKVANTEIAFEGPWDDPATEVVRRVVRETTHYTELGVATLNEPVPTIQVGNLRIGDAKLVHALFTDDLW